MTFTLFYIDLLSNIYVLLQCGGPLHRSLMIRRWRSSVMVCGGRLRRWVRTVGQPYAVPLNYVLVDRVVYIHSADAGHKVTNLQQNPGVSFAVVRPGHFDMRYRSAVLFGAARLVTDPDEKQQALEALMKKYAPGFPDRGMAYIRKATNKTAVFAIEITHLAGKAR